MPSWCVDALPCRCEPAYSRCMGSTRFDITNFEFDKDDEAGMLKTMSQLNQLISAEVDSGIPPERIVLGGFSQGGAISLLTGLTSERKLAGISVMSGWLPMRHKVKAVSSCDACVVDPLVLIAGSCR